MAYTATNIFLNFKVVWIGNSGRAWVRNSSVVWGMSRGFCDRWVNLEHSRLIYSRACLMEMAGILGSAKAVDHKAHTWPFQCRRLKGSQIFTCPLRAHRHSKIRDGRKLPGLGKESFLLAKAITKPTKTQEDVSRTPSFHEVTATARDKS